MSTEAIAEQPTVPWRRLSVRMLLVHPVQELARALPVIAGLLILGSSRGQGGWWSLIGLGSAVIYGLLRWATTRYRVTPKQVEIERGLVNKRVVTVPLDRVRTVDVTAHALHRGLGLARVTVGTGQSDRQKHEGLVLDGMPASDARRLRDELLHNRGMPAVAGSVAAAPAPERVLARFSPGWIKYGPLTLSGLVTVGVVLAFAWRTFSETNFDPQRFRVFRWLTGQLAEIPVGVAIAEAIVGAAIVVAVLSTLAYALAFWGFTLSRNPAGTLHVSRGLVTRRATTIEERRLRGVELSEPLLLRAAKAARLITITTGLRIGRGAERGGSMILPPAPLAEAERVGLAVLDRTEVGPANPLTASLVRHPTAALRRRLTRALLAAIVLIGLAAFVSWLVDEPEWAIGTAIVAIPASLLLGVDRYRSLGHAIVDRMVVFRLGSLVRRRSVLAVDGIIGVNVSQSFFQRRSGLVTLTATTAAGRQHYELVDVGTQAAAAVADTMLPGLLTPFLVSPEPSAPRLQLAPSVQSEPSGQSGRRDEAAELR